MPQVEEIEISEAAEQEVAQKKKSAPIFGYYRQPNGFITVTVTSPLEKVKYVERGWMPLPQYGTFDLTTEYAANHPFELLFMRGGAKEMPAEQVLEQGFNIHSPVLPSCDRPLDQHHKQHAATCWSKPKKVTWPELSSISFPCTADEGCSRALPENAFPTERGRNKHEEVMHKEKKSELRASDNMTKGLLTGIAALLEGLRKPGTALGDPVYAQPDITAVNLLTVLEETGLTENQVTALRAAGLLPEDSNG